jgi:hypothetical protein
MAGIEEVLLLIGYWCWWLLLIIVIVPLSVWYIVRLGTFAFYQSKDNYFKSKKAKEDGE